MIDDKSVYGIHKRRTYIRTRTEKDDLFLFSTEIDSSGTKIENWFITTVPEEGWIMRIDSTESSHQLYLKGFCRY